MASLWTLLNFDILTALWISPDKFALIVNSWTGSLSTREKSTFYLFTYSLSFVGNLFSPLAITEIDRTLTWAVKGTIKRSSPSQSEAANLVLSNLSSKSLKTVFPELAVSSFKHRTLSVSILPYKSLAFSTPIYSAQPQLGPWTWVIMIINR